MRPPLEPHDVRRALFVRLRRLGDTLLMAPALAAFRAWAPAARTAIVTRRGYEAVVARLPEVDELLLVGPGAAGLAAAARAARRFRPDLAVDYHGSWCAAAIVAASGARLTVGEARFRWPVYDLRVPRTEYLFGLDRRSHTVENHLAPLAALGVPTAGARLTLSFDPAASASLERRLDRAGVPAGARIVLFPTTTRRGKQWPLPRWSHLAARLARRSAGAVLLQFGPGEEGLAVRMAAAAPGCHAIEGLPFDELCALVASAALVIAHDSLGAHLAAAFGIPALALFGATDPARYHPWGDHAILRVEGLCCSPCGGGRCRSPYYPWACVEGLDEDAVLETALSRLREARLGLPATGAAAARA